MPTQTPFDGVAQNPFAEAPPEAPTPTPAPTQAPANQQLSDPFQQTSQVAPTQPSNPTQAPANQQLSDPFQQTSQVAPTQPSNPTQAPIASPFASAPNQQATQAPVFNSGGNSNQGRNTKYKIFDLYWFINAKMYAGIDLAPNECQLMNISYNIDFDNLRIALCQANQDTFTATSLAVRNVDKITNINIYSEGAEQLIDLLASESDSQFRNVERVFSSSWTANDTVIAKQGDNIIINSTYRDGSALFTLQGWQKRALNNACVFMLKEARILAASKFN